jgi:hypothetical protein
MTGPTRFLLRIARWIAGRRRSDWVDAMEAEAASAGNGSTAWALGCVWAAAKDRFARNAWVLVAVLILAACAMYWKTKLFFATSDLLVHQRISPWFAIALWIASPLPIAFLLGLLRPRRSTYLMVAAIYLVIEFAPLLLLWVGAGISPLEFFSARQVNWYKADPGARVGPAVGLTCDLVVWLAGAWLGMHSRRAANRTAS